MRCRRTSGTATRSGRARNRARLGRKARPRARRKCIRTAGTTATRAMPMATGNPPARPRPTTARATTVRATRARARAKARPGRASPMERDRARARATTRPTFTARETVRARVTDRGLVEPTATPAAERETATSRNDRRQPSTIESPGNGALSLMSLHVPRRYLLALRRDAARDRGLRARTAREAGDPRLHPRDDRRAPARRRGGGA